VATSFNLSGAWLSTGVLWWNDVSTRPTPRPGPQWFSSARSAGRMRIFSFRNWHPGPRGHSPAGCADASSFWGVR